MDTIALLNPDIEGDPTHMYGSKQIDYISISPALAEIVTKGGHHHSHQNIIRDHRGVHLYFRVQDLFDSNTFDKYQALYRRLRMARSNIITKCITRLQALYMKHNILERTTQIYYKKRVRRITEHSINYIITN